MAGATRANQDALLRDRYQPRMRVQFNLKSILLQYLTRRTKTAAQGKRFHLTLHTEQGGGPRHSRAGLFPPSDHEVPENVFFTYGKILDRIEIDEDHIQGARDVPSAAIIEPYEWETRSLVKRCRHALNYDLFGDGSAQVAKIESAASATTFTVDSVRGLWNGIRVDILKISNGNVAMGVIGAKLNINTATRLCTMKSPSQFADGTGADVNGAPTTYAVYRHGSYNDAHFGLDAVVNDANPPSGVGLFGELDRTLAENQFWQAHVSRNGGVAREITFPLIQEMIDTVDQESDGETGLILCGHGVFRKLLEDLRQARRSDNSTKTLNGWAQAIMHYDIPIVRDKHCKPDVMYGLDLMHLELCQDDEGHWMDKDGAILSRVTGKAAYEAGWTRQLQLTADACNVHWKIEDLEVPIAA